MAINAIRYQMRSIAGLALKRYACIQAARQAMNLIAEHACDRPGASGTTPPRGCHGNVASRGFSLVGR